MTDWASEQLSVYNDIKAEGFAITVRCPGVRGEFDPITMDWVSSATATDTATYALRKEYSLSEIDGTIVQKNDSLLIVPAYGLSSSFDTSYQILIGYDAQNVINISPVSPGNVPLFFNVQVRS